MTDSGQIVRLIEGATQAVAEKGMEATDREVILACFGYLGGKLGTLPCLANCPVEPKNKRGLVALLSAIAVALTAAAGTLYTVFKK